MVIADLNGDRYLVPMHGERANWVRNVRAVNGRAILRHGVREVVDLEEVAVGDRAPIVRRYVQVAPGGRPHIAVDGHAPLQEFEAIAPEIPVFSVNADRPGLVSKTP